METSLPSPVRDVLETSRICWLCSLFFGKFPLLLLEGEFTSHLQLFVFKAESYRSPVHFTSLLVSMKTRQTRLSCTSATIQRGWMTISTSRPSRLHIVLLTLSAGLKKLCTMIQLLGLVPLRYVLLSLTFHRRLTVGRHTSLCMMLESRSVMPSPIRVETRRTMLLLIMSKSLMLCFAKQSWS